jgi:plasmid maintenance system antidote protein VapI
LGRVLGTSAGLWLGLQHDVDPTRNGRCQQMPSAPSPRPPALPLHRPQAALNEGLLFGPCLYLAELYLAPRRITITEMAAAVGLSRKHISDIIASSFHAERHPPIGADSD